LAGTVETVCGGKGNSGLGVWAEAPDGRAQVAAAIAPNSVAVAAGFRAAA
jgi:hypothetical protein